MLSKSQISLLKSLQLKKNRNTLGLFLAEGEKSVFEFVNSEYQVETIYYTKALTSKVLNLSQKINFHEISVNDMSKISSLTTPPDIIAAITIPEWPGLQTDNLAQRFTIALDGIQDPGNLGTIIRTADWFNIKNIICSADTVDAYNPKVVQASMGSLSRVKVHYGNLASIIGQINVPVFGALLNGSNIYQTDFGDNGLIVMGNEGNGIRPEIQKLIGKPVTIPLVGKAESLNVAIATAIFCSEISRKSYK